MRATSVIHVEYEILTYLIHQIDVSQIKERMVDDEVSLKRFENGGENVLQLIQNLADRRKHRLPKDHLDYKEKGA